MPRHARHKVDPVTGWTDWISPIHKRYQVSCCDCGLVHRLNFRLVPYGKGKYKIQFQAFREEES